MRRKTLFWLVLAFLAALAMGALQVRQNWLTRGIPADLPDPIVGGGAQLGLNLALEQYDDAELAQNLAQIQALGVQSIKQSFYFADPFDWAASDRLIQAVMAHNLTLVPLLDGNPADGFAVVDTAVFASWAHELATRYGDHIQHYIIWDEPNLTSHWGNQPVNANEYAALLTVAASAIRSADNDALIVAAPLAPTVETGPMNLAETIYLRALYEAGAGDAFDIAAAKPYGFDDAPDDRDVKADILNFSRVILLREEMVRNGDGRKAIWAGNWGWNSLPTNWTGNRSIWGEVSAQQQADWTIAGLTRAQQEWPWMGLMFLENWQPPVPANDAQWGFSVAGGDTAVSLQNHLAQLPTNVALPGFHFATSHDPAQQYTGGWRFSPEFGADISEPAAGAPNDQVTFTFWGTDVGLRVRRADFRARLYVTVDGRPANALPSDENGTTLVLTSPDPNDDYITIETIAHDLPPGKHTVHIEAERGWDQWALNGFSVGYHPPDTGYKWGMMGLGVTAVLSLLFAFRSAQQAQWGDWFSRNRTHFLQWRDQVQLAVITVVGFVMGAMGWLTWGTQAASLYRRWGDGGQLVLTAVTATIFYVTPTFYIYILAAAILCLLISFRPVWGLALIAFSFPFYVTQVTKVVGSLHFSAVELFTLITFAAFMLNQLTGQVQTKNKVPLRNFIPKFNTTDLAVFTFVFVATLSLFFTERLDVAANEWRTVIIEPALFYLLIRTIRPTTKEMWTIWDAFVASAVVIAVYGLWQFTFDRENLITAEAGLLRLLSIYGSPNNVALYLGRVMPVLTAVILFGQPNPSKRRRVYLLALIPIILAMLFTFSKGGWLLGIPAGFCFVFWRWQKQAGRRTWPWLVSFAVLGLIALLLAQQIPQLSERLSLRGATGVLRLNLWHSSLNMFADHPWFGVGLDNFLYNYRSRYIFNTAWEDPDLNHPHNIILDFATRLGIFGLVSGGWLFWEAARRLKKVFNFAAPAWQPLPIALGGIFVAILAHGLVDHSFFLVDLAFVFYLVLGTAVSLSENKPDK